MFAYHRLPGKGALVALIAAAGLVAFSSQAMAAPTLSFDDDSGNQDGTVVHATGGPAIGSSIDFFSIVGIDTPSNAGVVLTCNSCELAFTTGTLITEGPTVWEWGAGGTFTLTGNVATMGGGSVASGTLVSGTFDSAIANGSGNSLIFGSFGTDTKNQDLLDYYGIAPAFADSFEFVNTELALNSASINPDGSFTADVMNADLDNTIPIPGSLGFLGLGLVALGAAMRRRLAA